MGLRSFHSIGSWFDHRAGHFGLSLLPLLYKSKRDRKLTQFVEVGELLLSSSFLHLLFPYYHRSGQYSFWGNILWPDAFLDTNLICFQLKHLIPTYSYFSLLSHNLFMEDINNTLSTWCQYKDKTMCTQTNTCTCLHAQVNLIVSLYVKKLTDSFNKEKLIK